MKHTISTDRRKLTIHVDDEERQELRELGEAVHRDVHMHDFLEPLTCNSELEWIRPEETGDLTSAPMLGILGEEETSSHLHAHWNTPPFYGARPSGSNGQEVMVQRITERWAFMDYQVRSVLEDLRDKGEVTFIS